MPGFQNLDAHPSNSQYENWISEAKADFYQVFRVICETCETGEQIERCRPSLLFLDRIATLIDSHIENCCAHPSLLFMAPYHCYNNNMSKLRPVIITNIQSVPERAIADQRAAYSALLQNLGTASFEKIQKTLDERKSVNPEHGLTPEVIERLKKRIKKKK